MTSLEGRLAVVTGASRGIGAAIATGLAARGTRAVLVARDPVSLRSVADMIQQSAGIAHVAVCDVADSRSVVNVAEEVRRQFGSPSILVGNAGMADMGLFEDMTLRDIDRAIDTNLKGVIFWAHAGSPQ